MPASQAGRRGFEPHLPLHFSTTWKHPPIPRYSVYSIKPGSLTRADFGVVVFEAPRLRVSSRLPASVPGRRGCTPPCSLRVRGPVGPPAAPTRGIRFLPPPTLSDGCG